MEKKKVYGFSGKVNEVKMNFLKKSKEEEMYGKIVRMLLKKGYKPLNNTTTKLTCDCKGIKTSNKSPKEFKYPYSISITYKKTPIEQQTVYRLAA